MQIKLLAIVCGLLCVFVLSYCKQGEKSVDNSPYLNHNDSVKYVGIDACAKCHLDKYSTFIETGMGSSFDLASLKKTSAEFHHVTPVYDGYRNLYYLPFLKDSAIYLKEYRLLNGDTIYSRTEKIQYIIGSGHHTNSHFIEENGYVFQAPLTFYTQKGKWDLPPGFENGNNTGFERKIGLECMSCHNAIPNLVKGSENQYKNLPHGINCERCHGPGEVHVAEKSKGIVVDVSKETDYTIVNPAKLSWNRQIDICQRCHLQGNAVLKPGKSFIDFRPGMKLSDVFDQFSPEYEGEDDVVMAAHAERFQRSKCFIASAKGDLNSDKIQPGFTCISCHNPHVSVRQTNAQIFNSKCRSCHTTSNQKQCSAPVASLNKENNNCVKCHMPSTGTSDIPHVTVHDHYIRKPSSSTVVKGKLKGLNCITNTNPDIATVTEAYVSYYEKFEANPLFLNIAKQKSKDLDQNNQLHLQILIHLYYINSQFDEIKNSANLYNGNDAWTFYRIAKAYERLNDAPNAELWFDKAVNKEPLNLDFLLQKGNLLIKTKQFRKAETVLNQYIKLYSKNSDVWAYFGLVYMNNNQPSKAKEAFTKSLSFNPDNLTALQNLLSLENILGNSAQVAKLQSRINAIKHP